MSRNTFVFLVSLALILAPCASNAPVESCANATVGCNGPAMPHPHPPPPPSPAAPTKACDIATVKCQVDSGLCLPNGVPANRRCELVTQSGACNDGDSVIRYLPTLYCSTSGSSGEAAGGGANNGGAAGPALRQWATGAGLALWAFALFYCMATVAEAFLCPAVKHLAAAMRLPSDIAGITLFAFATGAPDIFTQLAAINKGEHVDVQLAVSSTLGSGLFVVCVVLAVIIFQSDTPLVIPDKRVYVRDASAYLLSCLLVLLVMWDDYVHAWEAGLLLAGYASYLAYCLATMRGGDRAAEFQALPTSDPCPPTSHQPPPLMPASLLASPQHHVELMVIHHHQHIHHQHQHIHQETASGSSTNEGADSWASGGAPSLTVAGHRAAAAAVAAATAALVNGGYGGTSHAGVGAGVISGGVVGGEPRSPPRLPVSKGAAGVGAAGVLSEPTSPSGLITPATPSKLAALAVASHPSTAAAERPSLLFPGSGGGGGFFDGLLSRLRKCGAVLAQMLQLRHKPPWLHPLVLACSPLLLAMHATMPSIDEHQHHHPAHQQQRQHPPLPRMHALLLCACSPPMTLLAFGGTCGRWGMPRWLLCCTAGSALLYAALHWAARRDTESASSAAVGAAVDGLGGGASSSSSRRPSSAGGSSASASTAGVPHATTTDVCSFGGGGGGIGGSGGGGGGGSGRTAALLSAWAFAQSMVWMSLLADEVAALFEALGHVGDLQEDLLGATLLAWGETFPDVVSTITVARTGHSAMALAAAFGGPTLNLLVGTGASMLMAVLRKGPVPAELTNGVVTLVLASAAVLFYCLLAPTLAALFIGTGSSAVGPGGSRTTPRPMPGILVGTGSVGPARGGVAAGPWRLGRREGTTLLLLYAACLALFFASDSGAVPQRLPASVH